LTTSSHKLAEEIYKKATAQTQQQETAEGSEKSNQSETGKRKVKKK